MPAKAGRGFGTEWNSMANYIPEIWDMGIEILDARYLNFVRP